MKKVFNTFITKHSSCHIFLKYISINLLNRQNPSISKH
jgi:hypothetical protein